MIELALLAEAKRVYPDLSEQEAARLALETLAVVQPVMAALQATVRAQRDTVPVQRDVITATLADAPEAIRQAAGERTGYTVTILDYDGEKATYGIQYP